MQSSYELHSSRVAGNITDKTIHITTVMYKNDARIIRNVVLELTEHEWVGWRALLLRLLLLKYLVLNGNFFRVLGRGRCGVYSDCKA